MDRDFFETDLTGEIEEARELDHLHECRMRDIEQGIPTGDEEAHE